MSVFASCGLRGDGGRARPLGHRQKAGMWERKGVFFSFFFLFFIFINRFGWVVMVGVGRRVYIRMYMYIFLVWPPRVDGALGWRDNTHTHTLMGDGSHIFNIPGGDRAGGGSQVAGARGHGEGQRPGVYVRTQLSYYDKS